LRTIKIIEHISLDGVIQAPGGPDEDQDGHFEYGGWGMRYRDPVVGQAILEAHGQRFDLLLGRRTYDIFARCWPNAGSGPLPDGINAATKYVATHRPASLTWGPVEVLDQDLVAAVRALKSQEGPDLVVWGSSTLTALLLEHGLADEVLLLVRPVLLGKGKRLFAETAAARELALVSTTTSSTGVIASTYKAVGALAIEAPAPATV
jgi:dihydrofolate reductase